MVTKPPPSKDGKCDTVKGARSRLLWRVIYLSALLGGMNRLARLRLNDSGFTDSGLLHNLGHCELLATRKRYDLFLDETPRPVIVDVCAVTVWRPKDVLVADASQSTTGPHASRLATLLAGRVRVVPDSSAPRPPHFPQRETARLRAALVKQVEGRGESSSGLPARPRGLQRLLEAFSQVPLPRL